MDYNIKAIGERIKQERKATKLSQQELLEKVGYSRDSRQAIRDWELGLLMPDLTIMLKLCNIFNCDLGYLLCEYDCKTRAVTDICYELGLSEKAVVNLIHMSSYQFNAMLENDNTMRVFDYIFRYYWHHFTIPDDFQKRCSEITIENYDASKFSEEELKMQRDFVELENKFGGIYFSDEEAAEYFLYLASEELKKAVREMPYSEKACYWPLPAKKYLEYDIKLKEGVTKHGHDSEKK